MKIDKAKIRQVDKLNQNLEKQTRSRVSAFSESYTGEYYKIKVSELLPFAHQARKDFDEESLQKLADTIKRHGIRQPLTVLPSESHPGCYEVVSGERRLRAAKIVGLETVPCTIITNRRDAEEIAIIENIQREDLHPIELASAYNNLLQTGICKTQFEICEKLGTHKSTVAEVLALNNLDEEIKEMLLKNKIRARSLLRELCKHDSVIQQKIIIENYLGTNNNIQQESNKRLNVYKPKDPVLSIVLSESGLVITKNNINKLNDDMKVELEKVLGSLV